MGNILVDLSMSLDGFITGPNPHPGLGLGEGGQRLHEWMFPSSGSPTEKDREVLEEWFKKLGGFCQN